MEVAVNAGLIAAGMALYRVSLDFPLDAGVFPRVVLSGLLILCGVNLIRLTRRWPSAGGVQGLRGSLSLARMVPYIQYGALLLYVLGIDRLGFFTSTAAFTFASMALLGARGARVYAVTILVLTAALYLVFVLQFRVPLPRGALI